jgi:two-component system sensor histidine kinase KdpD
MSSPIRRYVFSGGSILLVTLLLLPFAPALAQTDLALLYLLVVLITATTLGRGPAILASLLAFLATNFFFVSPRYTLAVTDPRDLLRLVTFLVVAISTSTLTGRVRQHAALAERRAAELEKLYTLSQTISAEIDVDRILPVIVRTTRDLLDVPSCAILLTDQYGVMAVRASAGTAPTPAKRADTFLRVDGRILGVLRVTQRAIQEPLTPDERARLELIAGQIVLAVERARLAEEARAASALAESDRLKSVLLASVSHDLRTPLAVIKGAVTNLLDDTVPWDHQTRRELLTTMNEETDRLNRLVGNLLEMSRIEAGALPRTRSWQDVGELVQLAVMRMQPTLDLHPFVLTIAPDLPLVLLNATQIDQVLTNLLSNAANHTPAGTPITVTVRAVDNAVEVAVQDQGPGIPEGMTEHIFERFVRATGPEQHAEGSGLGLAIAKGLVEAHGGHIWARNSDQGGAEFVFTLPVPASTTTVQQAPTMIDRDSEAQEALGTEETHDERAHLSRG